MQKYKNKTVFITGVAGLAGSTSAKHFLEQGAHVVGLVKDKNKKSYNLPTNDNLSIVQGDIRDKDCLQYCLSKYEVDYVLHLASQPIVRICHNDPYTAYTTNVMGVINLFEACKALKSFPKKVVVMTSDKSYGPAPVPYHEDTPYAIFDSYTTSKICQDAVSLSYARTYGYPIVVVRAGNLYGPGDLNLSRLIPRSVLKMLDNESPMLYREVGEYIREFLYIEDIVRAYDVLLEKGVPGEAYNVGGTPPQRILDVITMIRDKINPSIPIQIEDKNFDEIHEQYLNADKIKALGWESGVDLSTGLNRTIEWYRDYKKICGW